MERIIVVDGTSNAGKTTLCENIEKNIQGIAIVPGASLFAKINRERYPKIPAIPQSVEEEKENQRFFFRLELDRLIEANRLAEQGKTVFMDRGVLEILSVAYSFESINGWDGIYNNAQNLYEKFISYARKMGISLPDKYIWLQANYEEIKRRNKLRQQERGQLLSETDWIEESLIGKQIEFFRKICIPENADKVCLVDTNNMTKQEVLEAVCNLLKLQLKVYDRGEK